MRKKSLPTLASPFQIWKSFLKSLAGSFSRRWNNILWLVIIFSAHNLFPQHMVHFKIHHVTYFHLYFYTVVAKFLDFMESKNVALVLAPWAVNSHKHFSSLSQKLWLLNHIFFTCFKPIFAVCAFSFITSNSFSLAFKNHQEQPALQPSLAASLYPRLFSR